MNHISQRQAFHQQCAIKIHGNDNPSICFESGSLCLYVHSLLRCIQGEMLATSRSFILVREKKMEWDPNCQRNLTYSILLQIFSNQCLIWLICRLAREESTPFPFQRLISKQPSLFFFEVRTSNGQFPFSFLFETRWEKRGGGELQEDVSIIYRWEMPDKGGLKNLTAFLCHVSPGHSRLPKKKGRPPDNTLPQEVWPQF